MILGMRVSILRMAFHDLSNTKPVILGATPTPGGFTPNFFMFIGFFFPPKSSWEQNLLAWPRTAGGGVSGNSWEQFFLMWSKMRVCARSQEQNAQVPGKQGNLSTSAMTGQRQLWGPDRPRKSFSGVWDFRLCLFDNVLCCRGGGGRQPQPQSSDLHSCENHPAIMQGKKLISMCAGATISFLSQHSHRNP